jgi:GNAT superfamily N-acetyltransferase
MFVRKKILELKDQEKEQINNLILSCFSNTRLETYDEVIYSVIEDNIIGFVGLQIYIHFSIINQLCVSSNYRNKGIASILLKSVEDYLTTDLILYIDKNQENTTKLYNFYLNRGYKEADINCVDKQKIEYKMIKYKPFDII